jgi:predicted pyridoxine 5'-phosphate oxidase superfamily flavin-nucleotide-binding protein
MEVAVTVTGDGGEVAVAGDVSWMKKMFNVKYNKRESLRNNKGERETNFRVKIG